MSTSFNRNSRPIKLFFFVLFISAVGFGFSDGILSNFFKDAYNVTTVQRGFIEIPRELPGLLCMFIISLLSFIHDIKKMVIAYILMGIGMLILGLFTPSFYIMSILLFVFSIGAHMSFPLQDSIGIALSEPDKVGVRMGQFTSTRTAGAMISGLLVFFGFKYGAFSFITDIKIPLLIAVGAYIITIFIYIWILKSKEVSDIRDSQQVKKPTYSLSILFKKKYIIYYMFSLAKGFHNQILFVYAPWILIELMGRATDTLALLNVFGAFVGMLFLPVIGKLIDKIGTKKLLIFESLIFLLIYLSYAYMSKAINTGVIAKTAVVALLVVGGLYILDRTFALMMIVRSVYIKGLVSDSNELTQILSTGLSLDHVVSVGFAFLGGIIWSNWGPEFVFYISATSCLITFTLAMLIKNPQLTVEEG